MAGLELRKPEQISEPVPERIGIYGRAGIGKSRTALMLPETEKWGEIIYYAADDNTEFLRSIPAAARKRINVVKPSGEDHRIEFHQFCMTDWTKYYPKAKTIVVDTFSTMSYRVIQQIANSGLITREEHFSVGDPKKDGFALPSRSDYQGIDSACSGFLEMLYDKQKKYNIILVFHEESKEVRKGVTVGGPALPGRRMIEYVPASLDTVIRLVKETTIPPGKQEKVSTVIAITDNDGHFVAKLRECDVESGNKLGRTALEKSPVSFWNKYDEYMKGNNE